MKFYFDHKITFIVSNTTVNVNREQAKLTKYNFCYSSIQPFWKCIARLHIQTPQTPQTK